MRAHSKYLPLLAGLIVATALIGLFWVVDQSESARFVQQQRVNVVDRLGAVRVQLESALNARLHLVEGLAAYVKAHEKLDQKHFDEFTSQLHSMQSGIRSLQLAPDGVVTFVYPLAGNEAAIGHDLLADPARREAASRAVEQQEFIIAGPVTLRQGGVALIGRLPVFDNEGAFWGFSITLIDFDLLLHEAGLDSFAEEYVVALRGKDGLGAEGEIFFGNKFIYSQAPVLMDVNLPNGSWQIAAVPEHGWNTAWPLRTLFWGFAIVVSLALGWFIYLLLHKPHRLRSLISDKEERFRVFYEKSPLSYQSLDSEGTMIEVNETWLKTFGYAKNEVLERPFTDFMTAKSAEVVKKNFPLLIKYGEVHDAEFEMICKDGKQVLMNLNGRSSYDENGSFVRTHCVLNDITDYRKSESMLKESEARYRRLSSEFQTLLEGIQDRIALLNKDLKIVWSNHDVNHVDSDRSASTGMNCYETWHGRHDYCEDCPPRRCFDSGEPEQGDLSLDDGRVISIRAFPIKSADGTVETVIEMGVDITDRIRIQAQNFRTAQLASLGELAAGVAHEINNPMHGVINYAQILANKCADREDEQDLCSRIMREGERVTGIVKSLLTFSRESGDSKTRVSIPDLIDETLSISESQILKEGVDLSLKADENIPEIEVYPQQIQQIVLNLLSNARYALQHKDMEEAKIIEVRIENSTENSGHYVKISVHDNGVGVPADLLPRIINPFITTKPAGVGTGLGLSICHELVQRHDGLLRIESDEGEFTRVSFELPVE